MGFARYIGYGNRRFFATNVDGTTAKKTFISTEGQTIFLIDYSIGYVEVHLNGLKLSNVLDYYANTGFSVVLNIGASVGDVVDIVGFGIYADLVGSDGVEIVKQLSVAGENTIDSFKMSEYTSVSYNIQLTSSGGFQSSELRVIHDGYVAYVSEYGQLLTNDLLGSYDVSVVGDAVSLICNTVYTNTAVTYRRNVLSNSTTQTSTSGTSYVDSTITGAITPTSATSKILIVVSVNGCEKTNASTQNALHMQLLRGAVSISEFAHYLLYTNSALANCGACSINYLDSPATTSATTYKVQFRNEVASAAVYVQSSSTMSTITLMEIAG
jgi:hypothetical protein